MSVEYFYVQINSSSNSPCQTLLKRSPFGSTLKILLHTLRKSKKKKKKNYVFFHSLFSRLQKFNWNLKPNWTQSQMRLHTIKPFLHIFQWCITTNSFTHLEHQVTWPKSRSKYITQNPNGSNNYLKATNWLEYRYHVHVKKTWIHNNFFYENL